MDMEIGKQIAEARKNRGLTQKQLAEESGVSLNAIFKIEQGRSKPNEKTLQKLTETLGINFDDDRPALMVDGDLPLNGLSDDEFENLTLDIVSRHGGYPNALLYRGTGDKQRDVISREVPNSPEFVLFQSKRWKSNDNGKLKIELDKIKRTFFDQTHVDGKPKEIIFCLSCNLSGGSKDKIREHAEALKLPKPEFWDLSNLSALISRDKYLMQRYFKGTNYEILENQEKILEHSQRASLDLKDIQKNNQETQEFLRASLDPLTGMEVKMRRIRALLERDPEAAKKEIYVLISALKKTSPEHSDLSRLYNNLGVCFNRSGGDFNKAIEYFKEALVIDPGQEKALFNLIRALLNKDTEQSREEALKLADDLQRMSSTPEIHALLLQIFLRNQEKKCLHGFLDANLVQLKEEANEDEFLGAGLVDSLLLFGKHDEALEIARTIQKTFPQSAILHYLLGRSLIIKAQDEDVDTSKITPIPYLKNRDRILEAVTLLEKSIELAKSEGLEKSVINSVRVDLVICLEWLGRDSDHVLKTIAPEELGPIQRERLQSTLFHKKLNDRLFDEAYYQLIHASRYDELSYEEKCLIVTQFMRNGAPLQAIKLLKELREEAIEKNDPSYWLTLSAAYAMVGEKNQAISIVEEAKRKFEGSPAYENILSQSAALAMRYGSYEETERLVKSMWELNNYKPVMQAVKVMDGDGLSEEVKEIFKKQHDFYEAGRKLYQENRLTTYWIQKYFKKRYPNAITVGAASGDTNFTIDYHDCPRSSKQKETYSNNDLLVIDYSALLTLARSNQLGLLPMMNKKIVVHRDLFWEVQDDLLAQEDPALRRIWNFIKDNPEHVLLYDDTIQNGVMGEPVLEKIFPRWLINSARIAEREKLPFLTDDVHLSSFLENLGLMTANTFAIFEAGVERKLVDQKQFAEIKGSLAELLYKFIPYDGTDLFYIALEDLDKIENQNLPAFNFETKGGLKFKISIRLYHLFNEITFPGSNIPSFYSVILNFIEKYFQTGILMEDKINMLVAVTRLMLSHFKVLALEDDSDVALFVEFMKRLWTSAYRQTPQEDRGQYTDLITNCFAGHEGDSTIERLDLAAEIRKVLKLEP